jgi:hypothetical protein
MNPRSFAKYRVQEQTLVRGGIDSVDAAPLRALFASLYYSRILVVAYEYSSLKQLGIMCITNVFHFSTTCAPKPPAPFHRDHFHSRGCCSANKALRPKIPSPRRRMRLQWQEQCLEYRSSKAVPPCFRT